jgi:hypothetical protein
MRGGSSGGDDAYSGTRDTSPRRIDLSNVADRPVNDGGPVGRQSRPGEYRFGTIAPSVDTSDW